MPRKNDSDAWAAMVETIGLGVAYAVKALEQSTALSELLVAKGVLTRAELDEQLRANQTLTKNLEALLDRIGVLKPDEES